MIQPLTIANIGISENAK